MKRVYKFSVLVVIVMMTMTLCQEDKKVPITGLHLNQTEYIIIAVNETLSLTAAVEPADATEKNVMWTSSNPNVAPVLGGKVTGLAPGAATIVATSVDGGISASINIMVAVRVTGIRLNEPYDVMEGKTTPAITYSIDPPIATIKSVRWSIDHPDVAMVDETTGEITGILVDGTATITATTIDGGFTDSRTITVLASIPVTGITLNPKTLNMEIDETATIGYSTIPFNASEQNVFWESSDPDVAEVDEETGEITAISPGKVTIKATSFDGPFTDECEVSVLHPNLLVNHDFGLPDNRLDVFETWVALAGNSSWFTDFYANYEHDNLGAGQGNQSPMRMHENDSYWDGNGSALKSIRTKYVARITNGNRCGVYQVITVPPGKYVFGAVIGYHRVNTANQTIKTGESLKILSPDGLTHKYALQLIPINYIVPNTTSVTNVDGEVTLEGSEDIPIRFQFDSRQWPNPDSAPLMIVTKCYFRKALD